MRYVCTYIIYILQYTSNCWMGTISQRDTTFSNDDDGSKFEPISSSYVRYLYTYNKQYREFKQKCCAADLNAHRHRIIVIIYTIYYNVYSFTGSLRARFEGLRQ